MDADEAFGMQATQGVRSGEKGGRIKFMLRDSRKQRLDGALLVRPVRDSRTDAVGSLIVMKRAKVSPFDSLSPCRSPLGRPGSNPSLAFDRRVTRWSGGSSGTRSETVQR